MYGLYHREQVQQEAQVQPAMQEAQVQPAHRVLLGFFLQ